METGFRRSGADSGLTTRRGRRSVRGVLYNAAIVLACVSALVLGGCAGADQDPGAVSAVRRAVLADAPVAEEVRREKQVLFGDLHVHTTYSLDAFFTAMPLVGGEGAHPPADACDFARHCAALDFFSITDHALELTPEHWAAEKDAIRQCNAVAGDEGDPDLIAFHGFEWTQMSKVPEEHFGHKNVIFRDLEEGRAPPRPISAYDPDGVNPWRDLAPIMKKAGLVDPLNWRQYADFGWMYEQLAAVPMCDDDVHTRDLPTDCMESALTPAVLFRKLRELDVPSLVIPHGNAWGSYTPPTVSWDKQLEGDMHDPVRQRLVEVMSGHGSSEKYEPWREFVPGEDGDPVCPEPTEDYLPCCWRAGEIMRERCGDLAPGECEARVEKAKTYAMKAGTAPDKVFPGTGYEDWLDCGQARGQFKPAYGLRPQGTTQYALSLSRPGEDGEPRRFRFGFIGSSDNHSGRAATGYKQTGAKRGRTDMVGPRNSIYGRLLNLRGDAEDPQMPQEVSGKVASAIGVERLSSFLYPGGLVAVHATDRSRGAVWDALESREVYGTSGPRILLWFDLLNGPAGVKPMGSEAVLDEAPRFRVRAVGAFEQMSGCPESVVYALTAPRVHTLCMDECYHPSDTRRSIAAIEVVRIRPQLRSDEDVTPLIEDPWRRFACEPDADGCVVEFSDPDWVAGGRDAVYYVRALEEAAPAINGDPLRTRFDAQGQVASLDPCIVGAGERFGDGCLADVQERAWSSPIFVDQPRPES